MLNRIAVYNGYTDWEEFVTLASKRAKPFNMPLWIQVSAYDTILVSIKNASMKLKYREKTDRLFLTKL